MTEIELFVPGEPQVKQRPRFRRRGAFVSTYTPEKTLNYENSIKKAYKEQIGDFMFTDVPLKVNIVAYFGIPKSFSKKKAEMAENETLLPVTKKDIDNCAKAVLDGLQGFCFNDDKFVTDLIIRKRYSKHPGVEIVVKEVKI